MSLLLYKLNNKIKYEDFHFDKSEEYEKRN